MTLIWYTGEIMSFKKPVKLKWTAPLCLGCDKPLTKLDLKREKLYHSQDCFNKAIDKGLVKMFCYAGGGNGKTSNKVTRRKK